MTSTCCIWIALHALLIGQAFAAGPFGFEYGMTKAQVVALVGQGAVETDKGDELTLTTAPKPHHEFESYMLTFSPKQGLLRIGAIGRTIETAGDGDDLRSRFSDIRGAIIKTYGPGEMFDRLHSGSMWKEPQYWMMGLKKKERTFESAWSPLATPTHITAIWLAVVPLSIESGYLFLIYEFEGFSEYHDAMKNRANTVF